MSPLRDRLVLQTLGFFLMFLTPGLFGFLFGSAAGLVASHVYGSNAPFLVFQNAPPPLPKIVSVELLARVVTMLVYGSLYVVFVFVHLKRVGKNDCVLRPTLTKVVIGLNAVLALLVLAAILLNFSVAGAWFLLAVYMSVPGFPIACACIGGDFEGALLMFKSFPIFALVSPSFVGSLSAYSAARIADLSWGNRPYALHPPYTPHAHRRSLGFTCTLLPCPPFRPAQLAESSLLWTHVWRCQCIFSK